LLAKAKMCPKGQGTNCKFAPARGFLSPDNYVQNPFGSQNYNRYSYVLNNPLKYIDPSGELPFLATLAIVIAGNYAIGWLDNVINKGMSAKEAFKNTNFIIGVDFNPGDMSKQNNYGFTNSQVDAHNEPKKDQERTEKVNKKLDDVRKAYGQAWREASSVGLLPPVDIKYPITSPYNEGNRVIPELGLNRPHLAIDIGTPIGTPVLSPWSGTVVMAQDTEYGLSAIVKHDYYHDNNYIQTGYAHLSKINISNGLKIQRGDTIGLTGTWGTGPHLHFTLRIGERKVNPTILFPYY
jgi:murein DD-endopeptidase MepM/ murein hydrolase activator NlpD